MKRRSTLFKAFTVIVAFSLLFNLNGCKYTDVLTEHIEDPDNGVLDESYEPIYKDVEGAPYDPLRSSLVTEESERVDEQEQEDPEYDEDEPTEEEAETEEETYDENSPYEKPVSNGDEKGEKDDDTEDAPKADENEEEEQPEPDPEPSPEEENSDEEPEKPAEEEPEDEPEDEPENDPEEEPADDPVEDPEEEPEDEPEDAPEEEPEEQPEEEPEEQPEEEPADDPQPDPEQSPEEDQPQGGDEDTDGPSGDDNVPEVYDDDGTTEELPEGVQHLVAAGQYATIVQMLAGSGGLFATDSEWTSMVAEKGIFDGEGAESTPIVFSGDTASGYDLDVDALIELVNEAKETEDLPDNGVYVIYDGSSVILSEDEIATLTENGIGVISLPTLRTKDTPDADVLAAVQTVAELLRDSDAINVSNMQAREELYEKLRTGDSGVFTQVKKATGGYAPKQINGSLIQTILQEGDSDSGQSTTEIMSLDNVKYVAYVDEWTTSSQVNLVSVANRHFRGRSIYLDGLEMNASEGVGLCRSVASRKFSLVDYYMQCGGVVDTSYTGARPDSTKAVVAGNPGDLITSSEITGSYGGDWPLWFSTSGNEYDFLLVGDGRFPGIITTSEEYASNIVTSAQRINGVYNIGQSYKVWVVPSGICGTWAYATPESFLMSMWVFCVVQANGDGLDTFQQYTDTYYTYFYRPADGVTSRDLISNFYTEYTAECPTSEQE